MAAMGFIFWPMVFKTIIGYTYIKMRSATVAVGAILIVFVTFGNIFTGVNVWITLLYILVSLGFTGLLLAFIIKRRGVSLLCCLIC